MPRILMLLVGVLLSVSVHAADSGVRVSNAWARVTIPGQDSGLMQFSISSKKAARLVAISCPLASPVEIHSMTHEGGMMKMRSLKFLDLAAGKVVDLAKNGNHVMLLNLKHRLKAGGSVPFTLTVQFADKRKVAIKGIAEVRTNAPSHDGEAMHDMSGMVDGHQHSH
ncbi:MAG: copper chaperone PCu(A)C [Gallionellaceae bacterium]